MHRKKLLTITVLILTLLLIGSGAYAAVSGNLVYTGNARLQGSIDATEVHFVVEQNAVSAKGGSTGAITLSSEDGKMNQVINIEATFEDIEDVLTFRFRLSNVGNYAARVDGVNADSGQLSGLRGSYKGAAGVTIAPGETVPASGGSPYTLTVSLKDMDADDIELGRPYHFSIRLPYEKAD